MNKQLIILLSAAICALSTSATPVADTNRAEKTGRQCMDVTSVYQPGSEKLPEANTAADQTGKTSANKQYNRPAFNFPDSFYIIAIPLFFILFFSLIGSYLKNNSADDSEQS
jgi:hypothetical protein